MNRQIILAIAFAILAHPAMLRTTNQNSDHGLVSVNLDAEKNIEQSSRGLFSKSRKSIDTGSKSSQLEKNSANAETGRKG